MDTQTQVQMYGHIDTGSDVQTHRHRFGYTDTQTQVQIYRHTDTGSDMRRTDTTAKPKCT